MPARGPNVYLEPEFKTDVTSAEEERVSFDGHDATTGIKRRRINGYETGLTAGNPHNAGRRRSLLTDDRLNDRGHRNLSSGVIPSTAGSTKRRIAMFVDESDSEEEGGNNLSREDTRASVKSDKSFRLSDNTQYNLEPKSIERNTQVVLPVDEDSTHTKFEGMESPDSFEDPEDDEPEDEELRRARWLEERGLVDVGGENGNRIGDSPEREPEDVVSCPICNYSLKGMAYAESATHVNDCLDGNSSSKPQEDEIMAAENSLSHISSTQVTTNTVKSSSINSGAQSRVVFRTAKPPQKDPATAVAPLQHVNSAFGRLMTGHAEDSAWKTAAAAEIASRGKPSYERTCPFYKILPGMSICVDAFRYGAVEGCMAYFLSHFHCDHYIGLTSTWCHGPIYCSRVTANLVKQQLRVDSKWVVPLEWEKETEVPLTGGVRVTMISANHCPGSSLFLFEQLRCSGSLSRQHRVLHCGDFRACREHLEHPLLRPDVQDVITGKTRQQQIDVCYLDTTYLNPKFAFPSQESVIQACADRCLSMNSLTSLSDQSLTSPSAPNGTRGMVSYMKGHSGSTKIKSGPRSALPPHQGPLNAFTALSSKPSQPRLLVVVGTYSIGKERICIGIARALKSKIYAPPAKMRICSALEDSQLNSLLTSNPREAQVHMTPLFEIRGDTLEEYLGSYSDTFTHVIGFRPTGWSYRPPGSRFIESPAVSTVLHGDNWKSAFREGDLMPQRGSTKVAVCYGVPYSEHSSFRELSAFVVGLRIVKVVPTVNVGSAKSRERMKIWVERWMAERKKGIFDPKHF